MEPSEQHRCHFCSELAFGLVWLATRPPGGTVTMGAFRLCGEHRRLLEDAGAEGRVWRFDGARWWWRGEMA